jgi:hypothetical protein
LQTLKSYMLGHRYISQRNRGITRSSHILEEGH